MTLLRNRRLFAGKKPVFLLFFVLCSLVLLIAVPSFFRHLTPPLSATTQELWERESRRIPWFTPWKKLLSWQEPFAHWFVGGTLNASYVCVDHQIHQGLGERRAFVWESENGQQQTWTYQKLFDEVNRWAFVLKSLGVTKGDRVIIYMPMIPETLSALLAVTRLGATHSVVFSGFSSNALRDRIDDLNAHYIITADYGVRRGKKTFLKELVDKALEKPGHGVKKVVVFERAAGSAPLAPERDVSYASLRPVESVFVTPEPVEANHPLFVLYTSGTTGKPKGIVHSTGGYLTYCAATFGWTFNPQPSDLYWCTADVGWITGHSYVLYAPLAHGISSFIFEGAPDFPDSGTWWSLIAKHKISIFYTAPTAVRLAIQAGTKWPQAHDLSSLRLLGSVGEPISPGVWNWYAQEIGQNRCPVLDTWWQTETGGFMIAPCMTCTPPTALKPGSATKPLPGVEAEVVDAKGKVASVGTKGYLVITAPWPGMAIGMHQDPKRFYEVYWSRFKHAYFSGDYAYKDADGYFWLLGRADEVLSLAGHRVGTAEVESAALTHPAVAEAAAIGLDDPIRGEKIVLFVALKGEVRSEETEKLSGEIKEQVRSGIGSFVSPAAVHYVDKLPKTRSGKIMRRLLKAVLENRPLGDISTLEDGASLEELRAQYQHIQKELSQEVKPASV